MKYSILSAALLIKILNFTRIINALKLYISFYISILTRKYVHWGYPLSISIEPSNLCNLKCPECPSGQNNLERKRGMIDERLFMKSLDQISGFASYLTLYFQGEPFLHPGITGMCAYASKKKNMFVCTSTNGHFFQKSNIREILNSGLSKIIVSLDGLDQETYQKYRVGGSYDTVIKGIRELAEEKKKNGKKYPLILLQFLVFKHNEHQINAFKKLGRSMGADHYEIKSAQIYNYSKAESLIPEKRKYSRYRKNNQDIYVLKKKLRKHCLRSWTSCVITWDGRVVPCCYDKNASYTMGNIMNQDLKLIWKSKQFAAFRKRILKSRKQIDICQNCQEGTHMLR